MKSLTSYVLATADQRRKSQSRLAKILPADVAAAVTLLTMPGVDPDGFNPKATDHASGLGCFSRQRVLTPLIEPNVLAFGRCNVRDAPRGQVDDEGVVFARWASPAAHTASTRSAVEFYVDGHDLVEPITKQVTFNGLDSWHSPLALIPVRHHYDDGSASVTRWMAADGTARIVGARIAQSSAWSTWLTDHPYTDPYGMWPTDSVTLRQFFAQARAHADCTADEINAAARADGTFDADSPVRPESLLRLPSVEDWADLILPKPPVMQERADGTTSRDLGLLVDVGLWNFRTHNAGSSLSDSGAADAGSDADERCDAVTDFINALDVFCGSDPFASFGLSPSVAEDRETVAEMTADVRHFLLNLNNSYSDQAARLALFIISVSDVRAAASGVVAPSTARSLIVEFTIATVSGRKKPFDAALVCRDEILRIAGTPGGSDLHGAYAMKDELTPEMLLNPTWAWFWLSSLQAVMYAALLGHLSDDEVALRDTIRWMLSSDTGRVQAGEYLLSAQDGRVRVPLVGSEGKFSNQKALHAAAANG